MKKVLAIVLLVVLLFTTVVNAETDSVTNKPVLYFSGNVANCSVRLYYPSKTIDATLKLYRGTTLLASWHKTGTTKVTITGTRNVVSGNTYTLKVSGTAGGSALNITPVTKTCP